MTSKHTWDGLVWPLFSWFIALMILLLLLGSALVQYGDLSTALRVLR